MDGYGNAPSRRAVVAGGLMAIGAGGAWLAVPRQGESLAKPDLAKVVPGSFSGWTADTSVTPLLPDEELQATIHQIYDETLARTYRDADGRAAMLVIAYGARQTESLQAHQPEVCYAAQGFRVEERESGTLSGRYAGIATRHVYATMGPRTEPIVYWLAVGGAVANFGMKLRWQQIKMGFRGIVPEGYLVRASLIGPDEPNSYAILSAFLASMLDSLPAEARLRMAGV